MKKTIWIGAAIVVAVAAAIPLWLVLDNGGERRAGALTEPTGTGDIGRLTISTINGGAPFPIRSFKVGRSAGVPDKLHPLEILRPIDAVSPLLLSAALPGTTIGPSAKLELLNGGKPYMVYEVTNPKATDWRNEKSEIMSFSYSSISKVAAGSGEASIAPASAVVGEMDVPILGKTVPITRFEIVYNIPDLASPAKHRADPVEITRAIDALAAPLFNKVDGSSLGTVTVRLVAPGGTTPYANYILKNASIVSVDDSGAAGSVATQAIRLESNDIEFKAGGNAASID
jgi:type VI protein secretion system component Hcp